MQTVGIRAKKNHLIKYYQEHFSENEIEMIEDEQNNEKSPYLKFQTKHRIITLSVDDYGVVSEDFRMRRGAGTKETYIKKQIAYTKLNEFLNSNYSPKIDIIKNSFDDSEIKIRLQDKIVTLKYDDKNDSIITKERKRKVTSKQTSLTDTSAIVDEKTEKTSVASEEITTERPSKNIKSEKNSIKHTSEKPTSTLYQEFLKKKNAFVVKDLDLDKIEPPKIKQAKHKKLKEGSIVRNIYSDEIFEVIDDEDGQIRAVKNSCVFTMTIADLEVIKS